MFRSFIRMLGLTGQTNRTSHAGQRHFSPRLETLDGRVMPSTLHVAAGIDTAPAMARSVETPTPQIWVGVGGAAAGVVAGSGHSSGGVEMNGGMPGGVLGDRAGMVSVKGGAAGGIVGSGHCSHGVDIYGGASGGVLGDRAGMATLDGGMPGGVLGDRAGMVSLDGGSPGGVLGDRAGMASTDTALTATRSAGEEIPQ